MPWRRLLRLRNIPAHFDTTIEHDDALKTREKLTENRHAIIKAELEKRIETVKELSKPQHQKMAVLSTMAGAMHLIGDNE